jgi:hypothetical protein
MSKWKVVPGSAAAGFGSDEFLDQKLRQARGVMPDHAVLFEQIIQHAADANRLQFLYIHEHRGLSACALPSRDIRRNYLFAGNNPVEQFAGRVCVNHAHMVRKRKSFGFAGLRH